MMHNCRDYYIGLDVLRLIAAIGIVGRHLNLFPCTKASSILLSFTDLNVGVFGVISGFFMARSFAEGSFELKSFITKKAKRLLPIYFFWTAVYIAFSIVFSFLTTGSLNPKMRSLGFWQGCVFYGGASCHLWYLIVLFYLTSLSALLFAKMQRLFSSTLLLLGASATLLWYSTTGGYEWWHFYFFRLFSYIALGCALYNVRQRIAQLPQMVVITVLLCAFICRVFLAGVVQEFYLDCACVVPMFSLAMRYRAEKASAVSSYFAVTSLGVYLVHPILAAGFGFVFSKLSLPPFPIRVTVTDWMIVAVSSVVVSLVLSRVKFCRNLIGG